MKILNEIKKSEIINKSKSGANYKDTSKGRNRFERRVHSRVANSVREFNQIDMNKLFKDDILDVNIKVNGETDDYLVYISFLGVLENIHDELERTNSEKVNPRIIQRALTRALNTSDDVMIGCSCEDFCLFPSTKIKLLDGRVVEVQELYDIFSTTNKDLWVYSVDENGDFKPGKILDVWQTGYSKEFIKVTLDNNKEIITTPNHQYMLRDGTYIKAKELKEKMSLMPLYFTERYGYECVKLNSKNQTSFFSTYKLVAQELLQEEIEAAKNRSGESSIAIHHKNFIKSNNDPSNLEPMGALEHYLWHAKHVKETGQMDKFLEAGRKYWENAENRAKQAEICRKVIKNYYANLSPEQKQEKSKKISENTKKAWDKGCFNTEKFKNARKEAGKKWHTPEMEALTYAGILKYWNNISEEEKEIRKDIAVKNLDLANKKNAEISNDPVLREERRLKKARCLIKKVFDKMIEEKLELNEENYELTRKNLGRFFPRITIAFDSFDDAVSYYKLNHKIKSIEYITFDEAVPIYDIMVDKYENFYVDSGVILHNCYRFGYLANKGGYLNNKGQWSQIMLSDAPNITNPNDDKGAGCKHILLVLNNLTWLIKVTSVINNYINYMEKHYQRLYADVIYPALYDKQYEEPVELDLDLDNKGDELDTDIDTIDISNKYARTKNQFKKGNEQGIRYISDKPEKEISFDDLLDDDSYNQ